MNRIKVAHITTVDISLRYLLLNQLESIRKEGFQVYGISSPGPEHRVIAEAGIHPVSVPMTRRLTPFADLLSLWRLFRVMRRERFTIVHTHTPKPGLLGQLAARMTGVPIVVNTLHGLYLHDEMTPVMRRLFILIEKIAARQSDVILSQNNEDIETVIRLGICPLEKITFLGNGIDLYRFDRQKLNPTLIDQKRLGLGLPTDMPVVGFVGRLAARRKGFRDFLLAGQRLAKQFPDIRLLIVGGADIGKPDMVDPSEAQDYGIGSNCIFLGQRPNSELPILYTLMDVLVLPSLFEGIPRAVMEASAMGVPVVATDVKGNREAVENGRNGLLVPLGDVQALSRAIIDLLTDRTKARRMGEIGQQMARDRFDEQLVFAKVKEEYRRLLFEKGLPGPHPFSRPKSELSD